MHNSTVLSNMLINNSNGIYLTAGSSSNLVANNTILNTTTYAVFVYGSFNMLANNSIDNSGGSSIYLSNSQFVRNNQILGNNVSNNRGFAAIRLDGSANPTTTYNTTMAGNRVFNSTTYGLYIASADNTTIIGDRYYHNNPDFRISSTQTPVILNMSDVIFDNPSGNLSSHSNISLNVTVPSFSSFSMNWSSPSAVPSPPPMRASFAQKYLNITTVSGSVSIGSMVWQWNGAEAAGYNESNFELWKYNASGWSQVPATLDPANHTFSVTSLSPQSIYAIYQPTLPTGVLGCTNITSTGEYYLASSVYGANISAAPHPGPDMACIRISASDVSLDCNGFEINGSSTSNRGYGVLILSPAAGTLLTNITVKNCRITTFYNGILCENSSGFLFRNNSVYKLPLSAAHGMDTINCSRGLITNNTIGNFTATTASGLHQAAIFVRSGSNNNNITDNIIYNLNSTGTGLNVGIDIYYSTGQPGSANTSITNNTLWNIRHGGIVTYDHSNGTLVINNSITKILNGNGIALGGSPTRIVSASVVANNTIYNTSADAIRIDNTRYANVTNNTIEMCLGSGSAGILMQIVNYSIVLNNSVYNCSRGLQLTQIYRSLFQDNILRYGTSEGILLGSTSTYDNFTNNTISNYTREGMYIAEAPHTSCFHQVANNTILNSGEQGIYTYLSGSSTFRNNTIVNSTLDGMWLEASNSNSIIDSRITDNGGYGIRYSGFSSSNTALITNQSLYRNGNAALFLEGSSSQVFRLSNVTFDSASGDLTNYSRISMNDTFSGLSSYSMNWSAEPPSAPGPALGGKFLNISRVSGTESLNTVVWYWENSEIGTLNESKLDIFKYNSTGWANLNAALNASANSLTLTNHNPASVYGIMEFTPASITNCLLINASGTYTLSQNLAGAPISASELPGGYYFTCIKIAAPNVVLDCAGYSLSGNNSVNGTGIFLSPASSNATVKNCNVRDYLYGSVGYGIIAYGSHNNLFMNNTINGTGDGFYIGASNNNTLANNTAYNNLGNGIRITERSNRSVVANNSAFGNNCNGFGIDGASANGTFTNNIANNNTCFAGFSIFASDNNTFVNNTACNNTRGPNLRGFQTMNANGNRFTNNTAFSVSEDAFAFYSATRSVLLNNTVTNATRYGYYLYATDDTNITNSSALNTQMGFFIDTGSRNWITGSTANHSQTGFRATTCTDCRIIGDYTFNQSSFAYFITTGSLNTVIANSTANRSNFGLFILSSTNTNLSNNTFFNSSSMGVFISDSTGVVMSGDRFSRNNPDLDIQGLADINATGILFADPSGILQNYTNLSISDNVGSGEAYYVNWSAQPSPLPPGSVSFRNKFVNITRIAGSVNISRISWSWLESELNGSMNESNFALYKYNSSGWSSVNSTPDTSGNTLSRINYVPGSTYAILEATPPAAETCPAPITSPGSYNLTQNAFGAPYDASPIASYTACVKIASSDVAFDCAGFNITNNGTVNSIGILLNGSLNNVTVRNCPNVSAYRIGVDVYYSNSSEVRNISISNSSSSGLTIDHSYGNAFRDGAFSNCGDGVDLDESDSNRLDNLTFYGNKYGLGIYDGSDFNNASNIVLVGLANSDDQMDIGGNEGNLLRNITITAYNDTAGDGAIYAWDNVDDTFENLTITQAKASGIYMSPASNLTVRDSFINSSDYGLYTDSGSSGIRFVNVEIAGSRVRGIHLDNASGGSFENVTVHGSSGAGAYVFDSASTSFQGGRFFGNSPDFLIESAFSWPFGLSLDGVVFTNPSGSLQDFTNLSITDSVDLDSSYSINWSAQPAGLPPDTASFGNKHINITKVFGSPAIDLLVWHWQGDELNSSHDEARFALFRYSGAWELVNGTPDTAANTLANATLADFSVFSILQNVSDITPPQVILLSPPNGSTLNASSANFSFIATDDSAAAMNCSIYLDSALNQTNSSVQNGTSTAFEIAGIADGSHYWTVNCSDGINSNASLVRNFTVDTPVPSDGGDDDEDRPLSVSAISSCNGTTVGVTSRGSLVPDVEIRVDGSPAGITNSSGGIAFEGCGKTVEIRASKPGYSTETVSKTLIGCDECRVGVPPKPPQNVTCPCGEVVNASCVPFECCSDSSCGSVEYCKIPSGKIGGECVAVAGSCGEAKNHTFVPYGYQCGTEPGCPSCPADMRCEAHKCIGNGLSCPTTGIVGDNKTCQASENEQPCANCDYIVTDPAGRNFTGRTDAERQLRPSPRNRRHIQGRPHEGRLNPQGHRGEGLPAGAARRAGEAGPGIAGRTVPLVAADTPPAHIRRHPLLEAQEGGKGETRHFGKNTEAVNPIIILLGAPPAPSYSY